MKSIEIKFAGGVQVRNLPEGADGAAELAKAREQYPDAMSVTLADGHTDFSGRARRPRRSTGNSMKFTMRMPFTVDPGPVEDGWYTARVLDKEGRHIGDAVDCKGRSTASQERANELAVKAAKKWARRVRMFEGL